MSQIETLNKKFWFLCQHWLSERNVPQGRFRDLIRAIPNMRVLAAKIKEINDAERLSIIFTVRKKSLKQQFENKISAISSPNPKQRPRRTSRRNPKFLNFKYLFYFYQVFFIIEKTYYLSLLHASSTNAYI